MSAKERIAELEREIESLRPVAQRERTEARLLAVEHIIALHDKTGWPANEPDYKIRLLAEQSRLRKP